MNDPKAETMARLETLMAEMPPTSEPVAFMKWMNDTGALGNECVAAGWTAQELQDRFNKGGFFFAPRGTFNPIDKRARDK